MRPAEPGQKPGTEPLTFFALRARLEAARTECTDTYAPDEFLAASRRISRLEKSGSPADTPRSSKVRREIQRAQEEIDDARRVGTVQQALVREKAIAALDRAAVSLARAEADGAASTAPVEFDRARERLSEAQTAFVSDPCRYPEAASIAALAAAVADKAGSEALLARTREEEDRVRTAEAGTAARVAAEDEARRRTAAGAAVPGAQPAPAAPAEVDVWIVSRGECLWRIAADTRVYGDPFLWPLIYHFNRLQIGDPDLIFPGQEFLVPRALPPETLLRASREARGRIWPVPNYLTDGR